MDPIDQSPLLAWPDSRESLHSSLSEAGLAPGSVARLAEQARPALVLETTPCEESRIPLGASKIGGLPDLPDTMAWPERPPYGDAAERTQAHLTEADRLASEATRPGSWLTPEHAREASREQSDLARAVTAVFPLAFIAQLDLAALSLTPGFPAALPHHGRLLLFCDYWVKPKPYDPHAAAGLRLIWDKTPVERLERKAEPAALTALAQERWSSRFKPAAVTARPVVTAIPPSDKGFDAFPHGEEASTFWDEDSEEIHYETWLGRYGTPDGKGGANHQLGGWPRPLQNGMQAQAQLASHGIFCGTGEAYASAEARRLLRSADRWRLLLQIGRDDALGLLPSGALYILMREHDMRIRAFDRAWMVFQKP
ncbi:DUF1963 domain-containing protein [Labrys portucalensis]|uniref:DUF1963 domain-containing protein n=1 Tax=Labrys neptuniae TaxID=376174 RepID=A0ABV6ZFC7_9HYPH